MEPRYYTTKSRAKLALVRALQAVRRSNGYNTDVNHVHRRRDMPRKGDDPPELFLMFGSDYLDDEMTESTNNVEYRQLEVRVVYYNRGMQNLDLECDLLEGDIVRAFAPYTVIDNMGPSGHVVPITYTSGRVAYFEAGQPNEVLGYMDFVATYWFRRDNPLIWDDQDSAVEITGEPEDI